MEEITNPHDKFFKETLSKEDVARDFVNHYLPKELRDFLDISSLRVSKDTFIDKALREHFSDLLYRINLKQGGPAYVYLLFEHKSFSDPLTGFQVLRYMVRIWERFTKRGEQRPFPPIVPMVVYHGKERWKVSLAFEDLFQLPDSFRKMVPKFQYLLCDLTRYSDEEIKGAVSLRVFLLLLKNIFMEDFPRKFPEILRLLSGLSNKQSGLEYLETILRYVASGADTITPEEMGRNIEQIFEEQGGNVMATLAEQWIEEGMQQGIQQGMQQGIQKGIQQGIREMLYEAISSRFGAVPEDISEKVKKIEDRETLRTLLRHAILSENLDNFRESLKKT